MYPFFKVFIYFSPRGILVSLNFYFHVSTAREDNVLTSLFVFSFDSLSHSGFDTLPPIHQPPMPPNLWYIALLVRCFIWGDCELLKTLAAKIVLSMDHICNYSWKTVTDEDVCEFYGWESRCGAWSGRASITSKRVQDSRPTPFAGKGTWEKVVSTSPVCNGHPQSQLLSFL